MTWIDALAILTLAVGFYAGWRAGLVAEFFDAGALVFGIILAAMWSGAIAIALPPTLPLSDPSRHLIAFWLLFLLIYAAIRAIGWFLARFRDWPGSKWVGGVGGGLIGAAKVLAALFVVLYVALFGHVDTQIRYELRDSPIARAMDSYFPPINDAIVSLTPRYYKIVARPIMAAHRL